MEFWWRGDGLVSIGLPRRKVTPNRRSTVKANLSLSPRLLVCLSLPAPPWSCAKENRPFTSEQALLEAGDGVDATTITQA